MIYHKVLVRFHDIPWSFSKKFGNRIRFAYQGICLGLFESFLKFRGYDRFPNVYQ